MKCGSLNFLEPSGPVQAFTGSALSFITNCTTTSTTTTTTTATTTIATATTTTQDSVVSIATRYRLKSPGIGPGWGGIFQY